MGLDQSNWDAKRYINGIKNYSKQPFLIVLFRYLYSSRTLTKILRIDLVYQFLVN